MAGRRRQNRRNAKALIEDFVPSQKRQRRITASGSISSSLLQPRSGSCLPLSATWRGPLAGGIFINQSISSGTAGCPIFSLVAWPLIGR